MIEVVDHLGFVQGQPTFAGTHENVADEPPALALKLGARAEVLGGARHVEEALLERNTPGILFRCSFAKEVWDALVDALRDFSVALRAEHRASSRVRVKKFKINRAKAESPTGCSNIFDLVRVEHVLSHLDPPPRTGKRQEAEVGATVTHVIEEAITVLEIVEAGNSGSRDYGGEQFLGCFIRRNARGDYASDAPSRAEDGPH